MNRKKWGYVLTLSALSILIISYGLAFALYFSGDWFRLALGWAMTALPLILLFPYAFKRVLKAYQILSLFAPWHFLIGGMIYLWDAKLWGTWFIFWSLVLEVGVILHNYQKRKKRQSA